MTAELLPSKATLIECMDLASTPEAAAYLTEQFRVLLIRRNLDGKFQPLVEKFMAFDQEVAAASESVTNPWDGIAPLTPRENASEQRVRVAEQGRPATPIEKVAIGINFGAKGELNRGYTVNNEPADEQATQRFDVSFHAWFARQSLIFNAPYIYLATESGDIATNDKGEQLRVNLADFKRTAESKDTGLAAYFNEHVSGVEVNFVKVIIPELGLEPDIAPAA